MPTACFNVLSYLLFMEGNFVLSMELHGLLPLPFVCRSFNHSQYTLGREVEKNRLLINIASGRMCGHH